MYFVVKHIHLTAVFISVCLFILRFVWLLRSSPMLQAKWVKILPHVVDTLLLVSAATLCIIIGQYPMTDTWLTQKLLFVILYILMGFVTLKWAHTKALRWTGFIGALACIMLAGKIAVTKQGLFFS